MFAILSSPHAHQHQAHAHRLSEVCSTWIHEHPDLSVTYASPQILMGSLARSRDAHIRYTSSKTPKTIFLSEGYTFNDVALSAQAFESKGENYPSAIQGMAQWMAWRVDSRELWMSQTIAFSRTFYYYQDPSGISYVTTYLPLLKRLVRLTSGITLMPNLKRTAELLVLVNSAEQFSFYEGVSITRTLDRLVWRDGKFDVRAYWDPQTYADRQGDLKKQLQLEGLSEDKQREGYYGAFREIFFEAFKPVVRLGEISSDLSGGLDSSSVSAVAATLLREEKRRLLCFGVVPGDEFDLPERRNWNSDDRTLMKALAAHQPNIDLRLIDERDFDWTISTLGPKCAELTDGPIRNPCNMGWASARYRLAAESGRSVLMTGSGGNLTFSWVGDTPGLYAQFRERASQFKRYLESCFEGGWWREFSCISPQAIRHYRLSRPQYAQAFWRSSHIGGVKLTLETISQLASSMSALEMQYDILHFDPTTSRSVLEYVLALPQWVFRHHGWKRTLAREALGDILPDAIRWNRTRGEQHAGWFWELKASVPYFRARLAYWKQREDIRTLIDLSSVEEGLKSLATLNPYDWMPNDMMVRYRLKLGRALHVADWLSYHPEC